MSTVMPTSTPTMSTTLLKENEDLLTWASYATGLISGVLLLELAFLIVVVCCRRRKIRQQEKLKDHIYHTIGQGEQGARLPNQSSSVTLTSFANVASDEPADYSQPIEIPNAKAAVKRSEEEPNNSAYSAGVHYDCIPGEPSSVTQDGEPKALPSSASEHVYSVIKDGVVSAMKQTNGGAEKETKKVQNQQLQLVSDLGNVAGREQGSKTAASKNSIGNYVNQEVDTAGEGFIEIKPRNTTAYDTLKHSGHQDIPEISLLTYSGRHDKLLSLADSPLELTSLKFNPYGQLSDDYAKEDEVLPDVEYNPYDDILGMLRDQPQTPPPTLPPRDDRPTPKASGSGGGGGGRGGNGKESGRKLSEPVPQKADLDDDGNDMTHAYDVIDELQKQIHILSQSIPTLDLYGYEDLDKIKPSTAPKASKSIPALDAAGYEDLDTVKPKEIPKRQQTPRDPTLLGVADASAKGRYSLGAALDMDDDRPPLVPPHTIESLYTAVQKKPRSSTVTREAAADEERKRTWQMETRHTLGGNGQKKSTSTTDLLEAPPPLPPMTVDALYTAVRKEEKGTTKGTPKIPPKVDVDDNSPALPPKNADHLYTTVQKRPKIKKGEGKAFEDAPPPLPPKTLEDHYLDAQKKGEVPAIPPRAMERLYSGVYKHKEEEHTVL